MKMSDQSKPVSMRPLPEVDPDTCAALLRMAGLLLAGQTVPRDTATANMDALEPKWCKGTECHAQDQHGNFVEPWDESAVRWTVIGALARYGMRPIPLSPIPGLRDESEFNAAWKYLFMAALIQSGGTSTPNGINNAGWEKTRDLVDLAIKLAENRAEVLITLALDPGSPMGKEMAAKAAAAAGPQESKPS
jgi:hypothetical protein